MPESLPTRELHRLHPAHCRHCQQPLLAREVVGSVALGFKDAPRCLTCLSTGLKRDSAEIRRDLLNYVSRRDCYRQAWYEAEKLDPLASDWPALPAQADREDEEAGDEIDVIHREEWDAGDLGCGELVLALRLRMNNLNPGDVLRLTATDPAAPEDIPSWCRLTGHTLVAEHHPVYYIRRRE